MRTIVSGIALAAGMMIAGSAAALPTYAPSGPQVGVSMSTVTTGGWTLCFESPFGQFGPTVASAVSACSGDLMMIASGVNGADSLLLSWATKFDVMFDTGTGNTTHNANGAEWYFNDSWSWGFAPAGAPVSRNSCDIEASTSFGGVDATTPLRLCWHTSGGNMAGGWRVGAADFMNSEPTGYTKYIFTANRADVVPEPGSMALVGLALLAGVGLRRSRRA